MKPLTLLAVFTSLFFFSCKQERSERNPPKQHEIPKPLQDNSGDFTRVSKRMSNNLLESIYADLVKKNVQLQELQNQMEHFNAGQTDSLQRFNSYDAKSYDYYTSANETLDGIKDSVLKQRLRVLLEHSHKNYNAQTEKVRSLINKTEANQLTMSDYYLTLKIAATLPVLEDYQASNLPDGKSVKAIANESEVLKQHTQELAAKYLAKEAVKQ
jgi:hypothetical protein